jgi:hypothetical protein
MALIDIEELKDVLGIGDIYADSVVQEVADAASNVILSYLTFNDAAIIAVKVESNVATYFTDSRHNFAVGASVVISGVRSPFSATKTITEKGDLYFKVALTSADVKEEEVIPSGRAVLASQTTLYDAVPEIREGALSIAVDLWAQRMGTMGQQGVDFQPAPYRLSRSLMTRISGLTAKHINVGTYVG